MKKVFMSMVVFLSMIYPIAAHASTISLERSTIELVSFVILMIMVLNFIFIRGYITYKKQKLTMETSRDPLTGLMSMKKLYEEGLKIMKQGNKDVSVIYLDVDNFKYVNEIFGYEEGTKILQEIAKKMEEYFVGSIAIARVSADKFAIITSRQKAVEFIEHASITGSDQGINILDHLSSDYYRIYTSAGVYHIDQEDEDISYCLDMADIARMKNKKLYGNTCTVFSKQMARAASVKNKIVSSMEKGIENKEFTMLYQPKVDIATGKVVGGEALVRWVSGYYNLMYPDHFIPIFERNGFILNLDYYTFERVCECLNQNPKMKEVKISVNLSAITLLDGDIATHLERIMKEYDITSDLLDIEITETALIEDVEKGVQKVNELREMGFSISMDDFGTGMSGLSRFSELTVDTLKVDKSFLDRACTSQKATATLQSIVDLGKKIHVTTIAEGVETQAQLELVKSLSFDQYQGFIFSKAVPVEEFIELL